MNSVIGIDFGHSSIRAVQISKKGKLKEASYVVEKGLIYDLHQFENSKYNEEFERFLKEADFSTSKVCFAVPEAQTFSTIISVPLRTEKEIKKYLELESSQIFPKPLSELFYSFSILGPNEKDPNQYDINVVASTREVIDGLYNLAKHHKLKLVGIEPKSYSIVRSIILNHAVMPDDLVLIVDMGSAETDMLVLRNGYVRFSRNLSVGGLHFTQSIANSLNLDLEKAEEYKKTYGIERSHLDGKVFFAVKDLVESIFSEIKKTINFYLLKEQLLEFKRIIFCGGLSLMPGILEYGAENLGMEVELANPFARLKFSPKFSDGKSKNLILDNAPIYTVSVGLALKGLI